LATSLLIVSCNHAEKLSEKDFDNRITFGWVEGNCIVSQKDAATHKRDMALIFDENKNILQRIDRADDPAWKTCPVLIRAQNNGEKSDGQVIWQDVNRLGYDVPQTCSDDLQILD